MPKTKINGRVGHVVTAETVHLHQWQPGAATPPSDDRSVPMSCAQCTQADDIAARIIDLVAQAPALQAARWREARYTSIATYGTLKHGDEFAYVAYTLSHFGQACLTQLTDAELERTYQHLVGKTTGN